MSTLELLFHHEASPYVRRVLIVCEELGLHPRETKIDSTSEEVMAGYAELNPNRRFPTLRDGDLVIWESNAINVHLAANVAAPELGTPLLGQSPVARSRVLQWTFWELAHFASSALPLVNTRLGFLPKPSASEGELLAAFEKACSVLERTLSERDYVADDVPTIADFALVSDFSFAREAKLPTGAYVHVSRWLERMFERPSWQVTEARKRDALAAYGLHF